MGAASDEMKRIVLEVLAARSARRQFVEANKQNTAALMDQNRQALENTREQNKMLAEQNREFLKMSENARKDAFRQLSEISEFFRKTEPHSPISYVLEKAVKWGDMGLAELVRELIPDSSSREYFGSLTGVKTDDE